jgi:exonuclease-1
MHRVRLLRHFGIKPYIVFDGGLLPAKKGTEYERKQKRDENLARGNALTAQGKHTQAQIFYLKCIDVTPQMAFQFIKVRPRNLLVIFVVVIHDFYRLYVQKKWIT